MPTDDLISVMIPAYNHGRYIEECVRSIIAQTYQNIELLVIDDGSKDKTFEILQSLKSECEKRFVRVVMETQENQGTRLTLNKLVDIANGKFICAPASDDRLKSVSIEKLHKFLSENPDYVLAVGDNEIINTDSKRVYWGKNREIVLEDQAVYKTFGDELHINSDDNKHPNFGDYSDLLKGNYIPNGQLILRQSILDVGKYDPTIYLEDWYMNLQLAKCGKFKYIPEILYSYRWHDSNTVSSPEFQKKSIEIYRQIYGHEKEYCLANGHKKQWQRQWCKRFGWRAKWKKLRNFIRRKQ